MVHKGISLLSVYFIAYAYLNDFAHQRYLFSTTDKNCEAREEKKTLKIIRLFTVIRTLKILQLKQNNSNN